MKGSYNQITTALKQSAIAMLTKGQAGTWANIPKKMNTLFQQTAYYWAVICQYRALQLLSRHNFNSAPPDFADWASAEVWGFDICGILYQYYCKSEGYATEADFHARFWDRMLERKKAGVSLMIPESLQEAALSLAKYQATINRQKGYYMTRSQLQKKSKIHRDLRKTISNNLQPEPKTTEEAVDAVLSAHTTALIVHFLRQNTDEAAMGLALLIGLKLIPSLSGGRIEDDKRRTDRLFEPACTCSLRKAQAGIDSILAGFAYTVISNRTDMISYWKKWLNQWDATEKTMEAKIENIRHQLTIPEYCQLS